MDEVQVYKDDSKKFGKIGPLISMTTEKELFGFWELTKTCSHGITSTCVGFRLKLHAIIWCQPNILSREVEERNMELERSAALKEEVDKLLEKTSFKKHYTQNG